MFLFAAILALVAPAETGWIRLFDEADESTSFRAAARRQGAAEAMVWIRHVYPRPRAGGTRSTTDQWLVSCRDRSFTMFAIVSYDRAGRILSARPIPPADRRAAPVIPGSRFEKVFGAVCG
jgi:hypothetical protein